jgi:hypothetical protein
LVAENDFAAKAVVEKYELQSTAERKGNALILNVLSGAGGKCVAG